MRESEIKRKTAETDISLSLCVDGTGKTEISTGTTDTDGMDKFLTHTTEAH